MFTESVETEPPECSFIHSDERAIPSDNDGAAAFMLAAVPPPPQTHALVIGRHNLEPILALMKSGCEAVESQSFDAPATHIHPVSLAWIGDIKTAEELETAVHHASHSLSAKGSMVLDATDLSQPTAVATVLNCLLKVGFRLRSVLHHGHRLILVAARRPDLALAA